jgi:hypothetical protein
MTPDKRKKIMALLASPASTENEKEICRKLLAKPTVDTRPIFNPSSETAEQAWKRHQSESLEDIFRRQAATAQQSAFYNQHTGQDARQQAAQNQQDQARQAAQGHAWNFDSGLFGGFGQAQGPQQKYSPGDFARAEANIKAQQREQEKSVAKIMGTWFFKKLRGE